MERTTKAVARGVVMLVIVVLAVLAGSQLYATLPLSFHKSVFGIGALMTTLFGSFCVQIMVKLEKMTQDAKGYPKKRMSQVTTFVRGFKARTLGWMVATAIGIFTMGAMFGLLQASTASPRAVVIVGYTALVVVLLNLARLLSIYQGLDRIDTGIFMQMQEEKARMETLKKMRREDLLGSFDDDNAPLNIVGYRQ